MRLGYYGLSFTTSPRKPLAMRLLDLIRQHKQVDLTNFVRLRAGNENIGWTKKMLAEQLASLGNAWSLQDGALILKDSKDLTEAVDADFHEAMRRGWIPQKPDYPHGDDWLGVGGDRGPKARFIVRRFFIRFLGAPIDSVFINGHENDAMWLAVRGSGVDFAAGTFDPMVGGARQHDQTIAEAALIEGEQEAGILPAQKSSIKPVGTMQLFYLGPNGHLKDERFHLFDFDTKGAFTPQCTEEWEISGFIKMPLDEVLHTLENAPEKFKEQIRLVVIDFLIRRGVIPKTYPEFEKIHAALYEQVDFNAEDFRALRA